MCLIKLPEIRADIQLGDIQFDMRPDALERWDPGVVAADSSDKSISIYGRIGKTDDGTGITANRIGAALRAIGKQDIVVNVNSPGGDFFEGVAIYNLLREHQAKVTIRVLGVAASAASVIAMAGDEILMGDSSHIMIHNAWAVAVGNRHDFTKAAGRLAVFDVAMAEVYAERSGTNGEEVAAMMDKETWITAEAAVASGFATGLLPSSSLSHTEASCGQQKAMAIVEAAMAKAGHSRAGRREVFKTLFSGKPSAAEAAMPRAGEEVALLQTLTNSLKV